MARHLLMKNAPNRRQLILSGAGISSLGLMRGFTPAKAQGNGGPVFTHGIASGDPLQDRVIIWTRVVKPDATKRLTVEWQVASDADFKTLVRTGTAHSEFKHDHTVKVDVDGLKPETQYFYRFKCEDTYSPTGKTLTLPTGDVSNFKMAVVSCSNYPQGYFHVYKEIAKRDVGVILHLGDYLYEYPAGVYSNAIATGELGREVEPRGELIALEDYRTRYGLYRTDPDLQAVHAAHPFICVWDDHEVANDTWKDGAENHNEGEGAFSDRKKAALQAYHEWLPIRSDASGEHDRIYRTFEIGSLASLIMLDTRIIGRSKPLSYSEDIPLRTVAFDMSGTTPVAITDPTKLKALMTDKNAAAKIKNIPVPFRLSGKEPAPILDWAEIQKLDPKALPQGVSYLPDMERFKKDVLGNPERTLLGAEQEDFLNAALASSKKAGKPWQVIGQQILTGKVGIPNIQDADIDQNSKAYVSPERLAQFRMLAAYGLPLNLDAWDGYPAARDRLFAALKTHANNTITLAGDTHNAWAFEMKDTEDTSVAVEFATAGVSSPGLETYLPADPAIVQQSLMQASPELKFLDSQHRGWLELDLTQDAATAHWYFINSVLEKTYEVFPPVTHTTKTGTHKIDS